MKCRWGSAVLAALCLATAAIVAGCGSSASSSSASAGASSSATSTGAKSGNGSNNTGIPSGAGVGGGSQPTTPDYAGLSAFERRCGLITARGAFARFVYSPSETMTRGDATAVTAGLTLNGSLPARQVIGGPGAVGVPGVVVSCRVQAKLTASTWDFNLDNQGWEERSFLATDTARWSWDVGPKIGGTHTLTLYVRPLTYITPVQGNRTDGNFPGYVGAANSEIQDFAITANVRVPWTEIPAEIMSRVAATLRVAQGLVESATLLVGALVAMAAALGFKRAREQREPSTAETTSQVEPSS